MVNVVDGGTTEWPRPPWAGPLYQWHARSTSTTTCARAHTPTSRKRETVTGQQLVKRLDHEEISVYNGNPIHTRAIGLVTGEVSWVGVTAQASNHDYPQLSGANLDLVVPSPAFFSYLVNCNHSDVNII